MRPLMPPVQTPDNLFHDGNPLTGELGTIVDAEHLNNVQGAVRDAQSELITVLTAAGINVDPSKQNQLLTALKALLLSRSNPFADIKSDGAAAIATALSNLGFVGSLTSPGYAVIPLGTKKLVIQWGTVTVPTAGSASAAYLLALDLGLAQFCTPIDVSSINNYRVGVATSTKTSITLASTNTQSVTGVMWLSIGTIY
ncbi:hypothetical protein [Enterobacter asburiae]|uniref:hypothetical protein n=1 Tax=Enterobacter asburiae TaxID=61645 RepID=UPI002647E39B|nr:hypothetical protein [Enterobacter asburiae]WKE11050.1 hypothetical protein QOM24_09970 [Enterobacter asburiae]